MKSKKLTVVLICAIFLSFAYLTEYAKSEGTQHKFVGTKKCKMCHNSAKKGAQFKHWATTKHSKAYETLGTAEAKTVGAKVGVTDPQNDAKCLKCHVTAYGVDAKLLGKKYKKEDGVSCESCHGAGEKYIKKKVMVDISLGKSDGAAMGLLAIDEKTCTKCHNSESPTFKDFKYDERLKKISHLMPAAYKTKKGYK